MRGVASILLVLAFAVALISLSQAYLGARGSSLETSSYALELERAYYAKLDFRHSVLQALSVGAGGPGSQEEKAAKAAEKLEELEEYLRENRDAELWCGIAGEREISMLAERMAREKRPLKCAACWSPSEKYAVVEGYPERKVKAVSKCLSFLDADTVAGKIVVSKGGLVFTKDPEIFALQFSGKFALGVSHYDEATGIGSVALVPEGTWVSYK